jgi:hypothetical protein
MKVDSVDYVFLIVIKTDKKGKGKAAPLQAWTGPGGS